LSFAVFRGGFLFGAFELGKEGATRDITDLFCSTSQEAYLFTAALAELKTGSQVKSRNDGVALRSMTAVLQRETDAVSQKLKEDMQRLQSDIQVRCSGFAID
jgi:hypothetical protein